MLQDWHGIYDQKTKLRAQIKAKHHDTKAAKRILHKLVTVHDASARVMVTDKLGSYGAVNRQIGLSSCDHRQHKRLVNHAQNTHMPIRRRERIMKRFKSARHLHRFSSIHEPIYNFHHFPHNHRNLTDHRLLRENVFQERAYKVPSKTLLPTITMCLVSAPGGLSLE